MKSQWMIDCDYAEYNSYENPQYKQCPHCNTLSSHGSTHLNEWTMNYSCGTILHGKGNTAVYIVKCPEWEKVENRDLLINKIIEDVKLER